MKAVLILSGAMLIVAGLILAGSFMMERQDLQASLGAHSPLSGLERTQVQSQVQQRLFYALGAFLGGIIAALPYFALAALLKRVEPPPPE